VTIEKPIVVHGINNSGTTILSKALRGHPALSGPAVEDQELRGMPDSMRSYIKGTFRLWAHPDFRLPYYRTEGDCVRHELETLRRIYASQMEPGTRLIIKTPSHTARARMIQGYFPDAIFVAIVRNAYAVVEGTIRKRLDDPERPRFRGLQTTVEQAAEHWFRAAALVVSQQQFLRRYLIIRYEDLVADPRKVLKQVLDHCELSAQGFDFPIFDRDLNRQQISRLQPSEIDTISRICQPMLLHFEYKVQ
jgi:hypothetical protein